MKTKLLKKVRNRYIFKWDGSKLLTYDRTDNKLDSFESIEEFIYVQQENPCTWSFS